MSDPLQFARQLLPLVAASVLLYVVVMSALRYQVVGVLLALAGAGGIVWGSWYVLAALSPENRSNELKDVAITFGIAAIVGGGLLTLFGLWTRSVAAKRKAARTSPVQRPWRALRAGGCACVSSPPVSVGLIWESDTSTPGRTAR